MALLRNGQTARVTARVQALDDAVDAWMDRIRRPVLDPVFYGASSAADHGLVWLAIGSVRAACSADPGVALRLGTSMGIESALTNGPIKMCFRRVRPELDYEAHETLPYGMHRPITSSFPSGHAASAFTAAVLLRDSPLAPAYFALAGLVATSRVYVKMHHASDVLVGAALGAIMGAIARRLLPL
ncbi:MAG TPA: phosphatase PAP2 family protein [Acidimicrobiia bacterium]|nr:phosphatase PAP2 family protein [Acidimicrobiia bacterium]